MDVVQCLLAECHADPNCINGDGSTPLSQTESSDIRQLLIQHGAVVTEFSPDTTVVVAETKAKGWHN